MSNLIKKIQNNIFQRNLFERGEGLVLGISGGPDSVCMTEILAKLQKKYDLKLILAHVNYGLRGKDSEKDQELVEELAQKYGLELFVLNFKSLLSSGHLPLSKGKRKTSFSEKELRDVRYDFFEKIRKENNFDHIAVAHSLDDQVETFLMRMIRGAGLSGLSAMKFKIGKIIRPLLDISKKEILEFLKANKIKYCIDKTNKTNVFFRNKIRNVFLPTLEKNFNPNIKKILFENSLTIADDYTLLSNLAKEEYAKIFSQNGIGSVPEILKLPESLQKMVLREAIEMAKKNLRDIDASHVEEILKAIKSSKNKSQKVSFKGLKLVRKSDKLKIS